MASEMRGRRSDRRVLTACPTVVPMAVRKKRSISMPPDLDEEIEKAARQAGTSYSGWLATVARKEFIIAAGLAAVADYERVHGAFMPAEVAEADRWADDAIARGKRSGTRPRRSA